MLLLFTVVTAADAKPEQHYHGSNVNPEPNNKGQQPEQGK